MSDQALLVDSVPSGQVNAHLAPGVAMRVGIPHRGGRLAFHAFNNGYPAMVSANAFWDRAKQRFAFPAASDLSELDFALDSAGYVAMRLWKEKGTQRGMAGVFPWTYSEYIEFATSCGAAWWSQPDLCCEPELASNQAEIDFRIDATATLLEGCLRTLYAWQNELAKTCSGTVVAELLPPPVPVLQGWTAADYRRSLDLLHTVWDRWAPWLAAPSLIGVGSVCRRPVHHPVHGLCAVLDGVERELRPGSRIRLFGVKGAVLHEVKMHPAVASADSMAYDFGARVKAHRSGRSNTISHRSEEMTRWMHAARARLAPSQGDQYRLNFEGAPRSLAS